MIKLALTDLDDTLIPLKRRDDPASPRAVEAIHAMLDAGLRFGPVSGRTPSSMARTFAGDERCYATGAYANGQIVMLDGEVIHRAWCSAEALQKVVDVMDDLGEGVLSVYDVELPGTPATFVTARPEIVEAANVWFSDVPPIVERVGQPYLKANVHSAVPRERLVQIRDILRAEVPELGFVFPSPTAPLIDITPAGYGKGSAVVILADAIGIGRDEVAVFGDSENALTMLHAVPNSVAVANASAEAAAAARWHIGASEDEGVAEALLDIAAAAKTGSMPTFMQE